MRAKRDYEDEAVQWGISIQFLFQFQFQSGKIPRQPNK